MKTMTEGIIITIIVVLTMCIDSIADMIFGVL